VYSLWFATLALGPRPAALVARGSLAPTGVDEQASVLLDYSAAGALGVASASFVADTPTRAAVAGEELRVELDGPFYAPTGLRLVDPDGEVLRYEDASGLRWREGLCYQAAAAAAHLAEGRLEAPEHPLSASVEVLELIDEARRQLGAA